MFVQVKNENYGYDTATYGDYVAVGNPAITRFNINTASVYYTGSVDLFRYNKNTDQHDYLATVFKHFNLDVLLARETGSNILVRDPLHTELSGSASLADKDLQIDKNNYTSSAEDGFGFAMDMYNKFLVVSSPYYLEKVTTYASEFTSSGSAIDVLDLARTEFTALSQSAWILSIENPDEVTVTASFGRSVSINGNWIAVGSPMVSSSRGMVYMYRNTSTGSNYSWALFQKIEQSTLPTGSQFGFSLKLNKQSGSFSGSMIVGCGSGSVGKAFYYEYVSGSWQNTFTFVPTTNIAPLTFGNFQPYAPTMSVASGFGRSVSVFENTAVIGAYTDRLVYEFSGSSQYQQGSAYIFEKCLNTPNTLWSLVLKTYGTSSTLKNNRLGYDVDIFDQNVIVGIPKINNESMTSCYIGGTLGQLHQCVTSLENGLDGQVMLLQKNTSSNEWEITNTYQKKKKFLSPFRSFGNDVSIADKSMVVGAPMSLSGSSRQIDLITTQSQGVTLDDISGKAYIYNFNNLRTQFHVGNVFYRNGKIVVMTSGSAFDNLFLNPINTHPYEYDLMFKGQHTIFEKQVVCTVNPGEFNVSTNPTSLVVVTSSLDINGNGRFDFQDLDVVLSYMQYKNTSFLGVPVSTDWSSSLVTNDDEISLLNFYKDNTDSGNTPNLITQSILKWEFVDIHMQTVLDLNEDNRIDIRDMNIIWKYFTNRLTQENYATYITPACNRTLFSDIIDYMNFLTQRTAKPQIKSAFVDYERLTSLDKTGSFLAPMATTIGLYSGLELIGIAKLGSPIKITPELPLNFVVKMDY
jgi:hypothetical protein